jgi:uncharacterized protein
MKKLALALLALALLVSCGSKSGQIGQIAVAGESRLEVEADEIFINVRLRQYYLEEMQPSTTANPVVLRTLSEDVMSMERQFIADVTKMGIDPDNIRLQHAGSDFIWSNQRQSPTRLPFRSYRVQVSSLEHSDALLNMSLPYGASVSLGELRYSKMEELQMQAKREALANARLRADNLAQGYGKVIGLLFVTEEESRIITPHGNTGMVETNEAGNMLMDSEAPLARSSGMVTEAKEAAPVAMRQLVVTARVDALFAIK